MKPLVIDMVDSVAQIGRSRCVFETKITSYQAALMRRDWEAVEVARLEALAALEAHLDAFAVAHRRLEVEVGG